MNESYTIMNPSRLKKQFIAASKIVNKICKPLFKNTPIKGFSVSRKYDDGSLGLGVLSDSSLADSFLTNDFHLLGYEHYLNLLDAKIELWSTSDFFLQDQKAKDFYQFLQDFSFLDGFSLREEQEGYTEYYYFAFNQSTSISTQFIFSHLEDIKLFIMYFREQISAHKDLQAALNLRYFSLNTSTNDKTNRATCYDNFKNSFKINRFIFGGAFGDASFSQREIDCMKLYARGKTAKEIGKILCMSSRTVETHFENIKRKTNTTKLGLFEKMIQSDYFHALPDCYEKI